MRFQSITLKARIFWFVLLLIAAIPDIVIAKVEAARPPDVENTSAQGNSNPGKKIVPDSEAVNKKMETQFSWISYVPVGALVIAALALVVTLYVRSRRLYDVKETEQVKNGVGDEHEREKEREKKEQQHKTDAERYSDRLIEELGKNTIFGMPGIDGAREAVDLPETFVPPDISVNEQHQQQGTYARTPETKTSDVTPIAALNYVVERSRMLVIIGEPGSGKTTIIKHFALSSLRLAGFTFPVPILYMPLSKMAAQGSEQKSFSEKLADCFQPNLKISDTFFENRLKKQRSLVLLDGLDEISDSEQRKKVCIWISDASKNWKQAFFVVTTRDKGYGENEQTALQVDKLPAYVKRFTVDQQRDFLQKWFRATFLRDLYRDEKGCSKVRIAEVEKVAGENASAVDTYLSQPENEGMRKDLAGIPLLLQLMAILWKQSKAIPENREKLYSVALDYLLFYRENEKGIPPFLPATEFKKLLEPVSLWMQDMKKDSADMEKFHDRMQQDVDILDYKYRSKYRAEEICHNLVSRAGVLGISGSTYVFSHKTFREYLAGLQLVRSVTSEPDRIENLVGQVGDEWWDEPLLFFAAQVDSFLFNKFMLAFFDSPKSDFLDPKTLNFLQKLIRKAPQTVDAFRDKLLHPDTPRNKQYYLLECLKTVGTRQAVETAQRFKTLSPLADTELLRKADEVIVTDEVAVPAVNPADLDQPGDGVGDEHPEVLFSAFEQNAQYILIRNGRHSVDGKEQVGDLYVAKYPVTNKLYRNFITYLQSADNAKADDILSDRLFKLAGTVPGFLKYLDEEPLLSKRCCSKYDDDRRFNEDDQPVVGVSWYAARAYCLWLSLLESKGTDPDRYRLPKDKEWEYAAAGKDGRKYPWSKEKGEPTSKLANYGENVGATTPVGSYPEGATPEGLYDMAGNVWEWMDNLYDEKKEYRSLRGGSWSFKPELLRCSVRNYFNPDSWLNLIGFRVVRSSPLSSS
ncbi:SUMF1/EgtB/PvdO family nonheme iron enzyme [Chlorobium sp. BLA1]|uniref:SUMF1/EgtB/PvdO family nonheme iron enzyme n=1 Tax=Candidatus Chlorobium masyuteum TaxID=2716876 RepID=UPI0014203F0A|nr:SUMF1/EgtB/PvdO family nonheme iron enzyme [Candidatus Chlorobium masyuteum]NHQ61003.1 SUMF1/EgtB/PvdO family nonheme iron enzyme [Candidatus Chlorobium masyuteum]